MKILFLTAHLPFPPASGGRRREFELISRLGKRFEIHLCSLTTDPDIDIENAKHLNNICQSVSLFKAYDIPENKHAAKYPWLMRRYFSGQAILQISQLLTEQKFDFVHIEGYYLMRLVPAKSNFRIVLVEHNMEYKLNLQKMLLASSLAERQFYWQEYYYTLYWERECWRRSDKVIALTSDDETSIKHLEPDVSVTVIPNGIDHDLAIDQADKTKVLHDYRFSNIGIDQTIKDDTQSILFVGNFLYPPNIDAALYFCKNIFPLILKKIDNAILFIVGNSPPPEIRALGTNNDNIVVTGYVASLYPFYQSAKVVVCPLRIGGGIKVKILEALRIGRAIVSTSVGAQGLNLDSSAIRISDNISEFANYVVRFLANPRERRLQEQNALQYAKSFPMWNQVIGEYVRCYAEVSSNS